eukprot:SAG11_NODE_2799_length_2957_cov_4.184745_2_plen_44_part_00
MAMSDSDLGSSSDSEFDSEFEYEFGPMAEAPSDDGSDHSVTFG